MGRLLRMLGSNTVLVLAGIAVVSASFWVPSAYQQELTERSDSRNDLLTEIRSAMLEQETGLRGFELTNDESFLEPYASGRLDFQRIERTLGSALEGDADSSARFASLLIAAHNWQRSAESVLGPTAGATPVRTSRSEIRERKRLMDVFRSEHARLTEHLFSNQSQANLRARELALTALLVLCGLYAGPALFVLRRRHSREHARRDSRREFGSVLQSAESEDEVCRLLLRRIARAVPEAGTVVSFRRNASDDRLEAKSEVVDDALAEALRDAAPRSCLAVRNARLHQQNPTSEPLLPCELCRTTGMHTTCVPSLVGGQVIGAVLAASPRPLGAEALNELEESVEQVAPVLASLRTLALAEFRAQTDPLTGLPNRRDAAATLHRMVAQAIRTASPLTALMIDVDHFKRLNDDFGHEIGDAALAAVTDGLNARLRGSDFAARWGGEEFLVLLPETERQGGVRVAEDMRETIARLTLGDRRVKITASFGVAELPTDGVDGDDLVRAADRALYAAKQAGRNQVVAIAPPDPGELAEAGVRP